MKAWALRLAKVLGYCSIGYGFVELVRRARDLLELDRASTAEFLERAAGARSAESSTNRPDCELIDRAPAMTGTELGNQITREINERLADDGGPGALAE